MALAKRATIDSANESATNDADDEVVLDGAETLSILELEPLDLDDYDPVRGIRNGVLMGATLWLVGIIATFAKFGW
jgi:hypothetical protein